MVRQRFQPHTVLYATAVGRIGPPLAKVRLFTFSKQPAHVLATRQACAVPMALPNGFIGFIWWPCRWRSALARADVANQPEAVLQALLASSTLDNAQARALVAMLSREVAVVQGPPGTGACVAACSGAPSCNSNLKGVAPPCVNLRVDCMIPCAARPDACLAPPAQAKRTWACSLCARCWPTPAAQVSAIPLFTCGAPLLPPRCETLRDMLALCAQTMHAQHAVRPAQLMQRA